VPYSAVSPAWVHFDQGRSGVAERIVEENKHFIPEQRLKIEPFQNKGLKFISLILYSVNYSFFIINGHLS
jgi:hypothetical protein